MDPLRNPAVHSELLSSATIQIQIQGLKRVLRARSLGSGLAYFTLHLGNSSSMRIFPQESTCTHATCAAAMKCLECPECADSLACSKGGLPLLCISVKREPSTKSKRPLMPERIYVCRISPLRAHEVYTIQRRRRTAAERPGSGSMPAGGKVSSMQELQPNWLSGPASPTRATR